METKNKFREQLKLNNSTNDLSNSLRKKDYNFMTKKRAYSSYKNINNLNYTNREMSKNELNLSNNNNQLLPLSNRNKKEIKSNNKITDLYCNKNIIKYYQKNKQRNKFSKKYLQKEDLFDKILKLKSSMNNLSKKYIKQKLENEYQAKEIKKQNKLLNDINIKNNSNSNSNLEDINILSNSFNYPIKNKSNIINNYSSYNNSNNDSEIISFLKYSDRKYLSNEENNELIRNLSGFKTSKNLTEKNNNISKSSNRITFNNLKNLYNSLNKYNTQKETEINILLSENNKLKTNNETLISNLKIFCNELIKSNEEKNEEIIKLKKSMKYTNYIEALREKEVYEKEILKYKAKLKNAFNNILKYKKFEIENQKLLDILKQKDTKIKILENKLEKLSTNINKNELNYEKIINQKDKEIKGLKEIKLNSMCININENQSNSNDMNELNNQINFYQLYIEMKKRGINSSVYYINNILNKLEELNPLNKNKIIFMDSIINLFDIKDINNKYLILDFANREFNEHKNIKDIKNRHIHQLNELFNKNNKLNSNDELINILNLKLVDRLKKEFENLDKAQRNYIEYYQMIDIINKYKLNDVSEEILLLTKEKDKFNAMNYFNLINLLYKGIKKEEKMKFSEINLSIIKNRSFNIINNKLFMNEKSVDYNKNIENILKNLSLIIEKEDSTPELYLSSIKKTIEINSKNENEKKYLDAINLEKFYEFIISKNIGINFGDKEKSDLFFEYGLKEDIKYEGEKYLNYKKITKKLSEFIKH